MKTPPAFRRRKTKQTEKPVPEPWTGHRFATWVTVVATVSTSFLTLLGYGHEIIYLEKFGLYPEDLQFSPLDFLMHSWRPVSFFFNINLDVAANNFAKLFISSWWDNWLLWLLLPIVSAFIACCYHYRQQNLIQIPIQKINLARKWITQSRWWQAIIRRIRSFTGTTYKIGILGWFGFPIFIGVKIVMLLISVFLLYAIFLSITLFPLLGVPSGADRANKEVLNPKSCYGSTPTHNGDLQARCLRVSRFENDKDNGKVIELARGYLIEYSADRVFLYQPCDKHVISVPLRNAVVEQVNTLGFAMPVKDCKPK